jgi:6-phosphogluconolactonase
MNDGIMKEMPFLRFIVAGMLLAALLPALPVPGLKHPPRQDYFLFIASRSKQGVYLYKFNAAGPAFTPAGPDAGLAARLPGVTAVAAHPGGRFLYAATSDGVLTAFAIHQDTGALRLLNNAESPHKNACSIAAEKKGWMLLVSYCGNGGVESFRIAGDGSIGNSVDFRAQDGSGAVSITPDNFFIFALGLDRIFQYRFDPTRATFWPNTPPATEPKPDAHPVSFAIRQDEKFGYSADEAASTLATFTYNREAGTLKILDSPLALPGNPSALEIDSAGRFLYSSNRIANTITALALDRKKGVPSIIGSVPSGAAAPSQLRIDPTGRFLFVAHKEASRITVFQIDPKTGLVAPVDKFIDLPEPVSFQFVPVLAEGIH